MYFFQQPATCTKCGHKRPSNGTDDDSCMKLNGDTVCPVCVERMLAQFCGHMQADPPGSRGSPRERPDAAAGPDPDRQREDRDERRRMERDG
jgi:hypothetical protein